MSIAVVARRAEYASVSVDQSADAWPASGVATTRRSLSLKRSAALRMCEIHLTRERGSRFSSRLLCRAVNLCERAIEKLFRDAYATTPRRWHLEHRLLGARQELLENPNVNVTMIAATWGFLELGRFSAQYRRQFGERPNETLHRARSSARDREVGASSIRLP